ncbi:hypothetical protein GGD63_005647 [Bradyrhizobium sp. cir1]|nr:hypothetical protein [Bradyrhizobium sp. cir1]
MATEIVNRAVQQEICIGIAARTDHIVNAGAVRVEAVPAEGIVTDGRHRPKIGHIAPEPVTDADMRAMERPRLAAEEALGEIVRVPEIEVADLRAFDANDAEELAARHAKGTGIAWRHDELVRLDRRTAGCFERGHIRPGHRPGRIDDGRLGGAARGGISGGGWDSWGHCSVSDRRSKRRGGD